MKKIHNLLTVLAIAAVSLAVTSCYDSWRDRYYTYWDYDYGYYGRSWDYNRDSYYHPGNYSDYNEAYDLADALRGEWEGLVTYQYTDGDNQKAQAEFGSSSVSTSSVGQERRSAVQALRLTMITRATHRRCSLLGMWTNKRRTSTSAIPRQERLSSWISTAKTMDSSWTRVRASSTVMLSVRIPPTCSSLTCSAHRV